MPRAFLYVVAAFCWIVVGSACFGRGRSGGSGGDGDADGDGGADGDGDTDSDADGDLMLDPRGEELADVVVTVETSASAAINANGDYVVAGDRGVLVGRGTSFEELPDVIVTVETPASAAINDDGRFVVAGDRGVWVGQVR